MSELRVTDVSEHYAEEGGGIRTYVRKKLEVAARHGVALTVIVPASEDGETRVGSGTIVRVRSPRLLLDRRYHVFAAERALHEAIERSRPDVLEASSTYAGGRFAARYAGVVPRVLVVHQDASLAVGHALFDRFVSRARLDRLSRPYFDGLVRLAEGFDATVVSGAWLAERLTSFGVPRVRAVSFGIDKAPFGRGRFDARLRAHLLARCEVPQDAKLLVAVSRHHPEKRLGTIIEAFERARRTCTDHELGLVIYGDGPLARYVRGKAARVRGVYVAGFTDDRDELARVLASADLFVHGSAAETYGIVLGEAITSGLPFVAPSFGGAVDLARPAYAALYPPGDAAACARAIEDVLTRDRARVTRALDDARDHVVRDADDHFAELFAAYRGLAASAASRLDASASETVGMARTRVRSGPAAPDRSASS